MAGERPERDDIFPNGYGCNQCDGTGFMPQVTLDRLRAEGYRVPWSDYPPGTPHLDPDGDLGRAVATDDAKRALATLSKSAPDLEACIGDPSHQYHSHDDDPIAAIPPAELDRLRRIEARWAKWIVNDALVRDHACAECMPGGPIVRAGFQCVYHEAAAALAPEGSAGTAEEWLGPEYAAVLTEGSARDGG